MITRRLATLVVSFAVATLLVFGATAVASAAKICSFIVQGDILAKYNDLGGQSGFLGCPVTDETKIDDGIGRFNHFENNGSIYWTAHTGAHVVYGAIRQKWADSKWEKGIGYPETDELATRDGGRVSHFERAGIVWYPDTGAYITQGKPAGNFQLTVFGDLDIYHACGWPCSSFWGKHDIGRTVSYRDAAAVEPPAFDLEFKECETSGIGGTTGMHVIGDVRKIDPVKKLMTVRVYVHFFDHDYQLSPGDQCVLPSDTYQTDIFDVDVSYGQRQSINRSFRLDDDRGELRLWFSIDGKGFRSDPAPTPKPTARPTSVSTPVPDRLYLPAIQAAG